MSSVVAGPAAPAQAAPEQPAARADETELARELENPLSKLGSIPLQNQVDLGIGPYDRARNTLALLPTYGFALTDDVSIVSRTNVPLVSQPDATRTSGYVSGLGDVVESLFVAPDATPLPGVAWGIGPTLLLPTATESALGAGKVGLGPAAVVVTQPKPWTLGLIAAQIWSVAGAANRADVSLLDLTGLAELRFPAGWYVDTKPEITANWNAVSARNTWTVPVGGGGGKVFFAETLPLDVSLGAYWNAIRPVDGPSASVVMEIALLFPH
ncbi:MAG TPA: hypothetical protein VF765_15180 [Polyangiaceae bacterium]